MLRRTLIFPVAASLALAAGPATAAVTIDQLIQQVQALRAKEAEEAKEREAAFRRELERQERVLREAVAERDRQEARSNALSKAFDENEVRIKETTALLEQHQGNLGELFGVTRQVAGDAANVLQQSLITVQFPAAEGEESRAEFLRRLAGAKALPSITELERLWFELMREMTEQSKVGRFTTPVEQASKERVDSEVVRVGPFTVTSEGRYLSYLPEGQVYTVLSRQPPQRELMRIARDLQQAAGNAGYMPAVVDPARGSLLALYVQRPSFVERIEAGELVGYVIIAVGILGVLVAVIQYLYLFFARLAVTYQARHPDQPKSNNALGRVLLAVRGNGDRQAQESPEIAELRISEAVLREVPKLERFQSFLRLAVAAGPLLGLIGTVIGMIITFQAITASGTSDPKIMANGIGQAMIATLLGLGIAIPLLFMNHGLSALSKSVVQTLDEHSNNLLAESIQKTRHA
jgi:biopolymer transport protein ExbB